MTTFPYIRLTASGTLGETSPNEIWTCSMKIALQGAGATGALLPPLQTDVDQVATIGLTAWSVLIASSGSGGQGLFSSWVALTQVKASAVQADGHNDPNVVVAVRLPSSTCKGAASSDSNPANGRVIPYQVAVVATLRGALFAGGSAGVGRLYLPCPNVNGGAVMTDGLMGTVATTAFATGVRNLIVGLNATTSLTSGRVKQVANIGSSLDAAGTRWQPVTKVVCDNRPDTVRKRYSAVSGRGKITVAV